MSKHFEGPLQVGYEFDETGYPLFVVGGLAGDQKRDRPTLDATAKVFAAAPDLLKSCKALLEELRLIREKDGPFVYDTTCRIEARAAIAKAE